MMTVISTSLDEFRFFFEVQKLSEVEKRSNLAGIRTPNLLCRKQTPYPLGHEVNILDSLTLVCSLVL